MRLFRLLIVGILCVLVFACAKEPDTLSSMKINKFYDLYSSVIDFDVSGDFAFVAEKNTGFSILNTKTSELLLKVDYDEVGVADIRNVAVIRYYPPLQILIVSDRSATALGQRTFWFKYDEQNNILTQIRMIIGESNNIRTIYFEDYPENSNAFTYFWGFFSGGNKIRKAVFDVNLNDHILSESIFVPNAINDIITTTSHVIAAMGQRGLYILDKELSDVSEFPTAAEAVDLAIKDNIIFVADRSAGLQIIDISEVNNPEILAHIHLVGNSISIDVQGDKLAVGTASDGVYLYDISNLTNPRLIDKIRHDIVGDIYKVKFHNNELYVANYFGLVRINY